MSVQVEFYGIPRQRAGVASVQVEADSLGEVFARLADQLPNLAESLVHEGRLRTGYLANVNGRMFTSDPATPLRTGDCVLILSADVGG